MKSKKLRKVLAKKTKIAFLLYKGKARRTFRILSYALMSDYKGGTVLAVEKRHGKTVYHWCNEKSVGLRTFFCVKDLIRFIKKQSQD